MHRGERWDHDLRYRHRQRGSSRTRICQFGCPRSADRTLVAQRSRHLAPCPDISSTTCRAHPIRRRSRPTNIDQTQTPPLPPDVQGALRMLRLRRGCEQSSNMEAAVPARRRKHRYCAPPQGNTSNLKQLPWGNCACRPRKGRARRTCTIGASRRFAWSIAAAVLDDGTDLRPAHERT